MASLIWDQGAYLQLLLTFFAIDIASAIIMVFFACLAMDFCSAIFAMPDVCGGIGLLSGFFMRQSYQINVTRNKPKLMSSS